MCVCGPEPGPAGSSTCWRPARVDFLENPACPAGLPPVSPGTPNCCWGLDCALWCCTHAEMQTDVTSWLYVLTGLPSIVLVESKAKWHMFSVSTCWVQSPGAAVCLKEPFFHFSGRHIPAANGHTAAAAHHTPLQERRVWSGMSRGWRGHSEAWGMSEDRAHPAAGWQCSGAAAAAWKPPADDLSPPRTLQLCSSSAPTRIWRSPGQPAGRLYPARAPQWQPPWRAAKQESDIPNKICHVKGTIFLNWQLKGDKISWRMWGDRTTGRNGTSSWAE